MRSCPNCGYPLGRGRPDYDPAADDLPVQNDADSGDVTGYLMEP